MRSAATGPAAGIEGSLIVPSYRSGPIATLRLQHRGGCLAYALAKVRLRASITRCRRFPYGEGQGYTTTGQGQGAVKQQASKPQRRARG